MLEAAAAPCGCILERMSNSLLWAKLAEWGYHIPGSERPDFVLFWDKDLRLAAELERQDLRLYNSAAAIEACDDKSLTWLICRHAGIPQPESIISPKKFHADGLMDPDFVFRAEALFGFPCVVKEAFGSFGQQVYLVKDRKELENVIVSIGERPYLIQRFVAASRGRDLRLQVVGDEVIAAMLRENDSDFRANLTNGGHATDYTALLTREQRDLAVRAAKVLGLDFAGVDLLFGENGESLLCEVNSNAHFKNLFDCTGVNAAEHILRHIINKTAQDRKENDHEKTGTVII